MICNLLSILVLVQNFGAADAAALRAAIGAGPTDVWTVKASPAEHGAVILAAKAWLATDGALSQAAAALADARALRIDAITWEDSPEKATQAEWAAASAVVSAAASKFDSLKAQGGMFDQLDADEAAQSIGLDPALRGIELSPSQVQAIRGAQQDRDMILLDARHWHDPALMSAARAAFESALAMLLSKEQHEAWSAHKALLAEELMDASYAEEAAFEQ